MKFGDSAGSAAYGDREGGDGDSLGSAAYGDSAGSALIALASEYVGVCGKQTDRNVLRKCWEHVERPMEQSEPFKYLQLLWPKLTNAKSSWCKPCASHP